MLEQLQDLNLVPTSGWDILINITVALICGLFIARLYRVTYKGPGYSVNFANAIVLLAMITSVVIMIIGNNLARAFGLVGAMSIIRFRTAVKETRDIVFIFFGLAIGMAAGAGYHRIALIGTAFIGLVVYLYSRAPLAGTVRKEYLLQFSFAADSDDKDTPPYLAVLDRHCRIHRVVNVRTPGENGVLELSYYVRLRNENQNDLFVRELGNISGVSRINLFFDEERF